MKARWLVWPLFCFLAGLFLGGSASAFILGHASYGVGFLGPLAASLVGVIAFRPGRWRRG